MPYADLVFTGGPVFTADTVRSRAGSVAVADGRIVAVAPGDLGDLVGPSTEVVDLAGRMLIPGFQDAHVHPVWGGLDMLRCDLSELSTAAEYLDAIGGYVGAAPGRRVDPRRRVADVGVPRRHADGRRARRRRPATARRSSRTATATARG